MFDIFMILIAVILVILNGFFVAAEFALVKVRATRLDEFVHQKRPFAKTARWLFRRMDKSLSACQLGITMASLGLGWIGEPAFAHLLRPVFGMVGIESEFVIHTVSFIVAFTIITAAHLVLGEQAPKIFAIRKPEVVMLWCALPMKFFYVLLFPFLAALNTVTSVILRKVGIDGAEEHGSIHSEDEIRVLLSEAHLHGEMTKAEHRLLNAVFEFDDTICRKVMTPRNDIVFFDINDPITENMEIFKETKHSRYPLCDDSLDHILGIVHIKDLLLAQDREQINLRDLARSHHQIPESMPISRLLRQFQKDRQHMAFVTDEYGTVVGMVTLENVIERIVGSVEDEFDLEEPEFVPEESGKFMVQGGVAIETINQKFNLDLDGMEVDTLSGLLVENRGRMLKIGDQVHLEGLTAEVLSIKGERAEKVRLTLCEPDAGDSKDIESRLASTKTQRVYDD